eukprot:6207521-Pleurochrysis_carterae.AAC.2
MRAGPRAVVPAADVSTLVRYYDCVLSGLMGTCVIVTSQLHWIRELSLRTTTVARFGARRPARPRWRRAAPERSATRLSGRW